MRIAVLDIGGTSIKSGIWTGREVTGIKEQETNAKKGGPYVMERVKEIIRSCRDVEAIGISTAGQVNSKEGYIRYANENIPDYTGMRIKSILEEEFHVPVAVENDVNAAAIGEGCFGAARSHHDFLCLTYGTGVGGAVVINKKVYTGSVYSAGEFGGIVTHPEDMAAGVPFSGCYEKYASATALVEKVSRYNQELNTGRKIFEHMEDPPVKELVDRWISEIVYGLVSLIHIFNPSCIVLGGGVMAQPYILGRIQQQVGNHIMSSFSNVELVSAELGNTAGMMGAAYLAECLLEHYPV